MKFENVFNEISNSFDKKIWCVVYVTNKGKDTYYDIIKKDLTNAEAHQFIKTKMKQSLWTVMKMEEVED